MAVAAQDHGENGDAQERDHEGIIESVPEDRRTPDRDQAAREILSWQERGEWPLSGPEMAERGEYSPQHYRNTVSLYQLNDKNCVGSSEDTNHVERGGVVIEIPGDADVESYARGYVAGYLDAHSSE